MAHIDEAKEYFGKDRYATQTTGIEILEAEPGYAKCCLKIEDKHKNALGQVILANLYIDGLNNSRQNMMFSWCLHLTESGKMQIIPMLTQ